MTEINPAVKACAEDILDLSTGNGNIMNVIARSSETLYAKICDLMADSELVIAAAQILGE
jgi:hypothetical protein